MPGPLDDKPPLPANSDAWKSNLKPWIRKRIEQARDELERPDQNVDFYRGQIDVLREIIRQTEPDAPEAGTAGLYFPQAEKPIL